MRYFSGSPRCTVRRGSQRLGETGAKVLNLIRRNKKITIAILARKLGISTRVVQKNLATLKERKLLRRVGSDWGGHWEVL
ncbi:MAG: MarR family transcriptional regulator [Elusimicrobiota bacterium]